MPAGRSTTKVGGTDEEIRLDGAGIRFGESWALQDISLTIRASERVALVGPSGAGKTTLLSLMNGSRTPTLGTVTVFGKGLAGLKRKELGRVQSRIGAIHQQFDLVGPLRVVHNVNAGRIARWSLGKALGSLIWPRGVNDVREALARVGIADKMFERTDRLSGGQLQRVAIARVLLQDPALILADEPIASLDPARARDTMDLLKQLATELGKTLVVSLHAFDYALSHCDRVIGLREGKLIFDAHSKDVTEAMASRLYRIKAGLG